MALKTNTEPSKLTSEQQQALESFLDALMAGESDSSKAFAGLTSFAQELKKRFLERTLNAELDHHLNNPKEASASTQNKRNGSYKRKVVTADNESLVLEMPRDRNGTFTPQIVPPHARRLPGFDDQIIELYYRGMSTRDIQDFIKKLYNYDISPSLISEITDILLDEIKEWQARPLDRIYPIVFFDAIRIKIRGSSNPANDKALHIAFAITYEGRRDVLGMWLADNEGASVWRQAFAELQNRGVEDVLIAVSDGLSGMTAALESAWPNVRHQTCIVHLIRNSIAFASFKDMKPLTESLKKIYQAPSAEAAEMALEEFAESTLDKRYSYIVPIWRRAWDQVIPPFKFLQ